jgi:hypothetical protein
VRLMMVGRIVTGEVVAAFAGARLDARVNAGKRNARREGLGGSGGSGVVDLRTWTWRRRFGMRAVFGER